MKHSTQVLMIDDSPIIDRRVLVEAQTLQNAGIGVCLFSPAKSEEERECTIQGIRCFRVYLSAEAAQIHQVAGGAAPNSRFRRWLSRHPKIYSSLRVINTNAIEIRRRISWLPKLAVAYLNVFAGRGEQHFRQLDSRQRVLFDSVVARFSEVRVVHAHDLSVLNVAIALCKRFDARLVFDAHEVFGLQFRRLDPARYYYNLKERYLTGCVDAVITVNSDCVTLIQKNVGRSVPFFVVSNAVDLPADFEKKKAAKRGILRRHAKLSELDKVVIFTGGINRLRKVHLLVEGMKYVANPHIHLFLMPLPYQIREFQELARRHGVERRVHFGPFVDSEEVLYWICDADVGIMPYQAVVESIEVSSPNKMFEFIACGLPMIGSRDLKNVRRVIEAHSAGVCRDLVSADDYGAAINEMFDLNLGGHQRFKSAVESIRSDYSWEQQKEGLLGCYRLLLGSDLHC